VLSIGARLRSGAPLLIPPAAILTLAAAIAILRTDSYPGSQPYFDRWRYIALAQYPFGSSDPLTHQAPFSWRLLAPLIVHVLPLPTLAGFQLLTVTSLLAAVAALMWTLEGLGFGRSGMVAGGLAFALLGPATAYNLFDYALSDPLALALLGAAVAFALHSRGVAMVVSLALCAAAKETAVLGAAFALVLAWERRDRRMLAWSLAGAASTVLVLAAIRLAIHPNDVYNLAAQIRDNLRWTKAEPIRLTKRVLGPTAGAWSVLSPFIALQLIHRTGVWQSRALSYLIVFATMQWLIGWDAERVVVYAYPAAIAAAVYHVQRLAGRLSVSVWALWLPLLGLEGWFALPFAAGRLASWDLRFPANAQEVALLGVLGLSVLVAVSLVVIELRRGHWRDLLWDNLGEFLSPAWLKGGAHPAVGAD
jgi:hypothetical protein